MISFSGKPNINIVHQMQECIHVLLFREETSAGNHALIEVLKLLDTSSNIWRREDFFLFWMSDRWFCPPYDFYCFLLYLPRRQINQEIKYDAVHFLFAFCVFVWATVCNCRGGQNTGERPCQWQKSLKRCFLNPDKAPGQSRWGCVGGGSTSRNWDNLKTLD